MFPFSSFAPGYLGLYWLTLTAHVLLMSFVIVGAAWVAMSSIFGARENAKEVAVVFRDWLPFALGAAITAGVAPLLFVQIVYRESYYTANLLLSHRFMAVVPALLVGFYGLYALKKPSLLKRLPKPVARALPWVPILSFLFIAWSFTENHLLSISPEQWVPQYTNQSPVFLDARVLPRLGMWLFGAVPVAMCGAAGFLGGRDEVAALLAKISIAGLIGAAGFGFWYMSSEPVVRVVVADSDYQPYLWLGGISLLGLAAVWANAWRQSKLPPGAITLALCTASVASIAAIREGVRISSLHPSAGRQLHMTDGLVVFLLFAVINAVVIGYLVLAARRELSSPSE